MIGTPHVVENPFEEKALERGDIGCELKYLGRGEHKFHLLDDDERDRLQADQRITKTVTRDAIMASPTLRSIVPRPRIIQEALDFLVAPLGLASRDGMDPCKYAVMIDIKEFSKRDWKDFFSERAARALVRKLKSSSRRPRRSSVDAKQLKLW